MNICAPRVQLSVVNGHEEYVRTVTVPVNSDGTYDSKYLPGHAHRQRREAHLHARAEDRLKRLRLTDRKSCCRETIVAAAIFVICRQKRPYSASRSFAFPSKSDCSISFRIQTNAISLMTCLLHIVIIRIWPVYNIIHHILLFVLNCAIMNC